MRAERINREIGRILNRLVSEKEFVKQIVSQLQGATLYVYEAFEEIVAPISRIEPEPSRPYGRADIAVFYEGKGSWIRLPYAFIGGPPSHWWPLSNPFFIEAKLDDFGPVYEGLYQALLYKIPKVVERTVELKDAILDRGDSVVLTTPEAFFEGDFLREEVSQGQHNNFGFLRALWHGKVGALKHGKIPSQYTVYSNPPATANFDWTIEFGESERVYIKAREE